MKVKSKSKKNSKINNITNAVKISRTTNRINFPKPQKVKRFYCKKTFLISYNPAVGMPSQKNYWNYWTDENWDYKQMRRKPESERGDKICSESLRDIYLGKKWEFLDQIKSEGKRQTLRSYIYHNIV